MGTSPRPAIRPLGWVVLLALAAGCGTMSNGRAWGRDATLLPGWERIRSSAARAACDPLVWGPLAAAALLQIDDADEQLSDWAIEHTPVFGSVQSAKDSRSELGTLSDAVLVATLLATPSGDQPGEWALAKLQGGAVEYGAQLVMFESVGALKDLVGRERPDGSSDTSFPSEHAARVSLNATLASRNTRALELSNGADLALNAGYATMTALAAWGRVEAGGHYPSDVLVGAAWGRFLGIFAYDGFMGLDAGQASLAVVPYDDGLVLTLQLRF